MFDIKKYEAMAMLELPEEENEQLSKETQTIIDTFAELDRIDASGAEPLLTVLELRNIMREDISEKNISREEILRNAPARHEGFFQAPGTLE